MQLSDLTRELTVPKSTIRPLLRGASLSTAPLATAFPSSTLAALTTCIPTSRMTEERRGAMLDDLRAQGRILSELVSWLPAFNARRP